MRIATATLLAFVTAGSALAQEPAKTVKSGGAQPPAHSKSEHKPSLPELAAKGNADAQYQLGLAWEKSTAVKVRTQALGWFILAGGNGSAPAALKAASIYEQHGDTANLARWLYRAGELGDVTARARFLNLFLTGKVKTIGGSAGASWLASRAGAGDAQAQIALGDLYQRGWGVPVDLSRAQTWFLEAALDGNEEAMCRLGSLQIGLPAVWRAPTREDGKDKKWLGPVTFPLRPNIRNKDDGRLDLGRSAVARENDLDAKDLMFFRPGMVEGERWLLRAAQRGYPDAEYVLGKAYVIGIDLPLNMPEGISWLEAAASTDHIGALKLIGDLAASGQGYPQKDPVRAWVSYEIAARLGDRDAAEARDRIAKEMNAHQIARARQLAQERPSLKAP